MKLRDKAGGRIGDIRQSKREARISPELTTARGPGKAANEYTDPLVYPTVSRHVPGSPTREHPEERGKQRPKSALKSLFRDLALHIRTSNHKLDKVSRKNAEMPKANLVEDSSGRSFPNFGSSSLARIKAIASYFDASSRKSRRPSSRSNTS